jgi:hypothetical protein
MSFSPNYLGATTPNIFSSEHIDKVISEVIPSNLPADVTHVVVGTVNLEGVQVVASFKRPLGKGTWELRAVAEHQWSGSNDAEAQVILKW